VILDHGKLATLSHQLVKHLKKIESLQELQASAFDGEAKRYDVQIAEVNTSLQKLYTADWKSALQKIHD
jgi:CRISPR/Cas system-associated endoribonuclease Cas2